MYWKIKVNRSIYEVSWEEDLSTTTTKKEHKLKYWEQTYGRQIIISNNRWD